MKKTAARQLKNSSLKTEQRLSSLNKLRFSAIIALVTIIAVSMVSYWIYPDVDLTVSGVSIYADVDETKAMFNLALILQAIMGVGFWMFCLRFFRIRLKSLRSIILLLHPIFWITLVIFPNKEGYYAIHTVVAVITLSLWAVSMLIYAQLSNSKVFWRFTWACFAVFIVLFGLSAVFVDPLSGVGEAIYVAISLVWVFVFTFKILRPISKL